MNAQVRIRDLEAPLEPRPLPRPRELSRGRTVLGILGGVLLLLTSAVWLPVLLIISFVYLYGKFCLYITTQAIDGLGRLTVGVEPVYHWGVLALLALPSLVLVPPLVVLNSINGIIQYYGRSLLRVVRSEEPSLLQCTLTGYLLSPLLLPFCLIAVLWVLSVEIIWNMVILPLFQR